MANGEVCAICLGTMNVGEGQALFTAECSHTFHFSCIASNVRYGNHICPTCRSTWANIPTQLTPTLTRDNVGRQFNTHSTNFADDETLPPPSAAAPKPATSSSTPTPPQNADMIVKALPEYPALSKSDHSNSFAVLLNIRAPPLSTEASDRPDVRAPLDLIAVLDVSGSMDGEKIRLLKQAVGFVADNLGPSDRLSVIKFANIAQRVTPLLRMTNAGRADTMQAVNSLQARGATNIIEGLKKAVEVLEQRREKNPVSSIILLSDGQDNQNGQGPNFLRSLHYLPLCLRTNDLLIRASQTDAVPVHSFGFGSDHDATALHAIADGSGGTFSYIESIEIIQDAFARCIGGLLSVVAQEVKLQVTSGFPGVQIQSIPSGRYRNSIGPDKLSGVIYLGDVYAEEEKQFLVYLSVPAADPETLTTKLIEIKCAYKYPLSNQSILSDIVSVEIRRPLTENLSEEDRQLCLEVDRERNRISIAEGITEAQAMAERGELGGAQSLLEQRRETMMHTASAQAGDPLCERLAGEVKEIQARMRSRVEYEMGGRAFAFSRRSAHMYQRASTQALIPPRGLPRHGGQGATATSDTSVVTGVSFSAPCASPHENMDYQTTFMRRMVQKSQELRQLGEEAQKSAESSNISNK